MAFGYFMNMEKLSLTIAEKHIEYMTDMNYIEDSFLNGENATNDTDCVFLDLEKLTNNIENGFVVITQLSCYFESFLNTIINACMNYNGEALLKCSIEEKIDLIFMYYQKDWAIVKAQNPWEIYRKTTKVRNELIHYKKTYIGDGTAVPDFQLGKQAAGQFFTKQNMKVILAGYVKLVELIARILDLTLFKEIEIFECDGRDCLVNYVYDGKKIEIDASRFE